MALLDHYLPKEENEKKYNCTMQSAYKNYGLKNHPLENQNCLLVRNLYNSVVRIKGLRVGDVSSYTNQLGRSREDVRTQCQKNS